MPKTPTPATGSVCGKRVEQGAIAYRCTLPQGHEFRDQEPCYAVEVDRSVRVWRRWADEQEAKAKAVKAEAQSAPFDQEKSGASFASVTEQAASRAASLMDELVESGAIVLADPPQSTMETPSEAAQQIRTIAAKAEQIVAKDPSLTPTLALWLATEQITRKDRAE